MGQKYRIKVVEKVKDGKGSRNTNTFLKDLFEEFAKRSDYIFEITDGDLPYAYREKQLHSVLVPSIDYISDALIVEYPTDRKQRGRQMPSHGWIDYWVKYGNTVFLIELKHDYFGLKVSRSGNENNKKLRKKTRKEWLCAIKHLEQIPKCDIEFFKCKDTKSVVKIALQFITSYTSSEDGRYSHDECDSITKIIQDSKHPDALKPNYIASWFVPKKMQKMYENGESYPYVHMVAQVQ